LKIFENVSSLKDATLRAGQLVETKGYYSPGDGGGGRYLIQDTATPDEYVDHTLASGTFAILQHNGTINVKQAGCTGVTDDRDNLNALPITDIVIDFNVDVIIASGTGGIGVDWNGASNLIITGRGIIIVPDSSGLARPFVIRNSTNVKVSGVTFRCEETGANPVNGLDIMNSSGVTVDGCTFDSCTFYGLGVYQDTIDSVDGKCDDILIVNNIFKDVGTIACEVFPKVKSNVCTIHNNTFTNCGVNVIGSGTGQAIKCGQGYERSVVSNNVIHNCGAVSSIAAGYWDDCEIINNVITESPRIGIAITVAVHALYSSASMQSLRVMDNSISRAAGTSTDPDVNIVAVDTIQYDSVKGSILVDGNKSVNAYQFLSARVGVDLANVVVNNNTVFNCANLGIRTDDSVGGVLLSPIFSNNTFNNLGGKTLNTIADLDIEQAEDPLVIGNTFIYSGEYALKLVSCTGNITCHKNSFLKGNVGAIANRAAILIADSVANTYHVYSNSVMDSAWAALILGTSAAPTLKTADNACTKLVTTSTPTVVSDESTASGWASHADAAITGYVTVREKGGTEIKLACIA